MQSARSSFSPPPLFSPLSVGGKETVNRERRGGERGRGRRSSAFRVRKTQKEIRTLNATGLQLVGLRDIAARCIGHIVAGWTAWIARRVLGLIDVRRFFATSTHLGWWTRDSECFFFFVFSLPPRNMFLASCLKITHTLLLRRRGHDCGGRFHVRERTFGKERRSGTRHEHEEPHQLNAAFIDCVSTLLSPKWVAKKRKERERNQTMLHPHKLRHGREGRGGARTLGAQSLPIACVTSRRRMAQEPCEGRQKKKRNIILPRERRKNINLER